MQRIVRRSLERDPSSSLGRKIAAAARRLNQTPTAARNLVEVVAGNLREVVLTRLLPTTQHVGPAATMG